MAKAKAKQRKIRDSGAIPERRHDAFLLALLLALFLNVSFFAIQALIPRLSHLLQLLGPAPAEQVEPDADAFPFVLVPADLIDEEILSQTPPQAISTADREARQTEPAEQLPIDKAYVPEGVEELVTPLDGQSGPEESSTPSPESAPSEEQTELAETPPEEQQQEETPEEVSEPEGTESAEDGETFVPPPPPEPVIEEPPPPEPEPAPEEIPPEPEPPVEPPPPVEPEDIPEPELEPYIPPPPAEEPPEPEPEFEPEPPEPEPEPVPQPEPTPDITPEVLDLASLPQSNDGYLDAQRQYLEEIERREELARQQRLWQEEQERREQERLLEQQRQYEEYQRRLEEQRQLELQRQREELLRQQEYQRRQEQLRQQEMQRRQEIQRQEYERQLEQQRQREIVEQQEQQEQQRSREGRRQPTFRKIGPAAEASQESRESRRSAPGGAPRQRNQASRINLLDSDPNMKVLAHRYGPYMKKLAEQLQQSLNREVILNPTYYTRGQSKIFFTITADGRLGYYDTQYPADGELDYVRITSERTLINAVPFDPPSQQMLQDPLFQKMSLTVNLY